MYLRPHYLLTALVLRCCLLASDFSDFASGLFAGAFGFFGPTLLHLQ